MEINNLLMQLDTVETLASVAANPDASLEDIVAARSQRAQAQQLPLSREVEGAELDYDDFPHAVNEEHLRLLYAVQTARVRLASLPPDSSDQAYGKRELTLLHFQTRLLEFEARNSILPPDET